MTETLPKRIGRYELRRELGRGAMGVVYEAQDSVLGRTVALKTIHVAIVQAEKDRHFEERFLAEARAAARLSHSPAYMSPERAIGQTDVDGRSDLFSLGTILYELLSAKRAFSGRALPDILTKVAYEHPPAPTEVVRSLPGDLDDVVARALAKSPEDRYPDGRSFAEDLEDVLSERPPRQVRAWRKPAPERPTMTSGPQRAMSGSPSRAGAELAGDRAA